MFLRLQPLEQQQGVVPDLDAEYRLFDRVVNVRESFTVPLGLRGTIVGIKGGEEQALQSTHTPTLKITSQVLVFAVFVIIAVLEDVKRTRTRVVI